MYSQKNMKRAVSVLTTDLILQWVQGSDYTWISLRDRGLNPHLPKLSSPSGALYCHTLQRLGVRANISFSLSCKSVHPEHWAIIIKYTYTQTNEPVWAYWAEGLAKADEPLKAQSVGGWQAADHCLQWLVGWIPEVPLEPPKAYKKGMNLLGLMARPHKTSKV